MFKNLTRNELVEAVKSFYAKNSIDRTIPVSPETCAARMVLFVEYLQTEQQFFRLKEERQTSETWADIMTAQPNADEDPFNWTNDKDPFAQKIDKAPFNG